MVKRADRRNGDLALGQLAQPPSPVRNDLPQDFHAGLIGAAAFVVMPSGALQGTEAEDHSKD